MNDLRREPCGQLRGSLPGRGNSKCKSPVVGVGLACMGMAKWPVYQGAYMRGRRGDRILMHVGF